MLPILCNLIFHYFDLNNLKRMKKINDLFHFSTLQILDNVIFYYVNIFLIKLVLMTLLMNLRFYEEDFVWISAHNIYRYSNYE